ncbi:translin-associated protein X [Parasteatoda tepidariorum]|uniref:translin-associated protein X n=1 Tax=Parasteatoda tepidariorum TaxID=114398 RepID=UPI001C724C34|nr:translin-associated protein X [Parasteatoda tepidariorum]
MSHRGGGHAQRKRKNFKAEKPGENANEEDLSPIAKVFLGYQTELDARYDKHERLIKKSRDLTIESKRIIFLLHRISNDQNCDEVLEQAKLRLNDLFNTVIHDIAMELSKREVYQFIKAYSAGLQEYVEAVSFYYYLKYGHLISIEKVHNQDFLKDCPKGEEKVKENDVTLAEMLSPTDYILGIADLTGELMRKCINSVANGDIDEPFQLCYVLQNIHEAFLIYSNHSRELKRKIFTLQNSLRKVENACYAIQIRGSEIPKHMLADFFSCDEFQESANCED